VIDCREIHRAQNPVGHIGWAGDLQEVATAYAWHLYQGTSKRTSNTL